MKKEKGLETPEMPENLNLSSNQLFELTQLYKFRKKNRWDYIKKMEELHNKD